MNPIALVLLLAFTVLPLGAAEKITVQQLRTAIAGAQAAGDADGQIAREIDKMMLTERLTDETLADLLQKTAGVETGRELQIQADRSAFLEPPASELPTDPRPEMGEQRLMIARTINYTAGFINGLPDFICSEVIRRLDDDPTQPQDKHEKWKHMQLRDTLVQQLTFSHGKESSVFQLVNGHPYHGQQEVNGMVTRGEFGNMLSMMLQGNSGMKAWWSHWEMIDGKRLAVFHYAVDRAHSQYAIGYCCGEIRTPEGHVLPSTILVAFEGELFLDPASGKIFRVTWQTTHLPSGFPTRQTSTLVEYREVSIGGKPYMCPVRSVSVSDSVLYSTLGPFTYLIHSINEARFTQYRKFQTEATLMSGRASRAPKVDGPKLDNPKSIQAVTPAFPLPVAPPFAPSAPVRKGAGDSGNESHGAPENN